MKIQAHNIIGSRLGINLALFLGRSFSLEKGLRIATSLGSWISRRDWAMVRAVRVNQWVVHGGQANGKVLDRIVEATFQNTARCLFELYHNLDNPAAAADRVRLSPQVQELIAEHADEKPGNGVLVVGVHLSNFDFLMHFLGQRGLRAQGISPPQPTGGYKKQNDMRGRSGIEVTPASKETLRLAQKRLERGGIVLSGLDRPVPDGRYQPRFFGVPAALPVLHVPLALRAGAPVVIVSALMDQDGYYTIQISDPIRMEPRPNRHEEILSNAERVLAVAERYIASAPTQWSMAHMVWPTAADKMWMGEQFFLQQANISPQGG